MGVAAVLILVCKSIPMYIFGKIMHDQLHFIGFDDLFQ